MHFSRLLIGIILIAILGLTLAIVVYSFDLGYAQPSVSDTSLNVESVIEGLSSPTSMAFLDNNNILVLEKEGQVRLVSNGALQELPVLQVPVNSENERGLLGIAITNGLGDGHRKRLTMGIDQGLLKSFRYWGLSNRDG